MANSDGLYTDLGGGKWAQNVTPIGSNPDGSTNVVLTGSYVRLSTEPKPTVGVQDGNDLIEVDTGKVFIFYSGIWREI